MFERCAGEQMPRWNFNEILSDVSVNLIKRRGGGGRPERREGELRQFLGTERGGFSIDRW